MAGMEILRRNPGLGVLLFFELMLFLVVSYQVQVDTRLSLLEKMSLMVFGPIQELSQVAVGSFSRYRENRKDLATLREENARLSDSLAGFERLQSELEEATLENRKLRELLELPKEEGWSLVHAQVIGRTNRRGDPMVTINKGSRHGIKPEQGVFDRNGVVGVVWEASGYYAKVMTVNNPNSVVASLLQSSRYQESFVTGKEEREAELVNFPNFEAIQPNDLVLTSGLDRIFPKGLPIGKVKSNETTSSMFQNVTLELMADFSRLEYVTVLIPDPAREQHEME